jgi:hypothetical protein
LAGFSEETNIGAGKDDERLDEHLLRRIDGAQG